MSHMNVDEVYFLKIRLANKLIHKAFLQVITTVVRLSPHFNFNMEGINTFLESSTIHGLIYISTTRKYTRLFWVLVVVSGFLGASLIIKESFDSWSESPVKTTIETLPIPQIRFPKVAVCPPKDTYTDLNYDLMMAENITLTEEMRDEMFKYALEVINEERFSQSWLELHEEDRVNNWYHGYTKIYPPSYDNANSLAISIYTSATSGFVTTQHYGDRFRSELVERKLRYVVNVHPPNSVSYNENVTLHFKVEKVSMIGLAKGSEDTVYMNANLDSYLKTAYTNFTPPGQYKYLSLTRGVSSEEVETQKLDVMPGFRFIWWYSGDKVTPGKYDKYSDETTKQFVR